MGRGAQCSVMLFVAAPGGYGCDMVRGREGRNMVQFVKGENRVMGGMEGRGTVRCGR